MIDEDILILRVGRIRSWKEVRLAITNGKENLKSPLVMRKHVFSFNVEIRN